MENRRNFFTKLISMLALFMSGILGFFGCSNELITQPKEAGITNTKGVFYSNAKIKEIRDICRKKKALLKTPNPENESYLFIDEECISCGACEPECPTEAISDDADNPGGDWYWIDPEICTKCVNDYDFPACVEVCPIECIIELSP